MKDAQVATLAAAGKPAVVCEFPDGSSVVVLPYGGRVLGLYAPSGGNFLWTNPALDSVDTARAFFASDQWQNTGGDRTWLAPEVDIFLPDYPSTARYWQPRQLDPGDYRIVASGDALTIACDLALTLSRTREEIPLRITKIVNPAPDPLGAVRSGFADSLNSAGLEYAGYTLRTTLERGPERAGASPLGLWNLLQLPHGGTMTFPTKPGMGPRVFFGAIGADDLFTDGQFLTYEMRAAGEHKIGLSPRAVTGGRVSYLYRVDGETWALVVRDFVVDPAGLYVDVPWDDPTDLGYAVQACNINNSTLGSFSELEYHAPAIGPGAVAVDESRVWAYRGPAGAIFEALAQLMGSRG